MRSTLYVVPRQSSKMQGNRGLFARGHDWRALHQVVDARALAFGARFDAAGRFLAQPRRAHAPDAETQQRVLVELDLGMLRGSESVKWVPVRAVQADSALQPRVWVLDPQSMTVSSREVAIGRMSSDLIEVTSGLTGGEEIVAVGAPYLSEGMKVTRMKVAEQAVPRASDPS